MTIEQLQQNLTEFAQHFFKLYLEFPLDRKFKNAIIQDIIMRGVVIDVLEKSQAAAREESSDEVKTDDGDKRLVVE